MIIQPIIGSKTTNNTSDFSSGGIKPIVSITQPILSSPVPVPQKDLFSQISSVVENKLNSVFPWRAETSKIAQERRKATGQTATQELMSAVSDVTQPTRQYFTETAKTAVNAIKGVAKLSPVYQVYRAAIGKPFTPKEFQDEALKTAIDTLAAVWRVNPAAPQLGATLGALKQIRQTMQAKKEPITWEMIADAAVKGTNNQPGVGEVLTDNVNTARAIDIVFLLTMVATPFAKKGLNKLNLGAEELNQVSKTLGVKPGASLEEVASAWKSKIKELPSTFTLNPNAEQMAIRTELNKAYEILKRAGVIDKKYAQAYDFITSKLGIKPTTVPVEPPAPKQLETGEKPIVRETPTTSATTQFSPTGKVPPLQAQKGVKLATGEGIPKELEPLAQEARKYKSAEEFVKEINRVQTQGGKAAFRDPYNEIRISSQDQKLNELAGSIGFNPKYKSMYESGANDKQVYTDFYTQATKGVISAQPKGVPTTKLSGFVGAEVEIPVAKAVEATFDEGSISSGFHEALNQRWTIVYEKPSQKLLDSAKEAGLEISTRESPKGSGQILTDVFLKDVGVENIDKATEVFNRFADIYEGVTPTQPKGVGGEILYHGTSKSRAGLIQKGGFKVGSSELDKVSGIYLTNKKEIAEIYSKMKKESTVISVKTTTNNPISVDDPAYKQIIQKFSDPVKRTEQLKRLGYDSVISKKTSEVIVFDPSKVISFTQPKGVVNQIESAKYILKNNTFKDFEIRGVLGLDPKYAEPSGIPASAWRQAAKDLGITEKSFVEGTSGNFYISTQPKGVGGKPITVASTEELLKYVDQEGYRTPEQITTLRNDIIANGIRYPVELIIKDDGTYEINDGKHRVVIANNLGIKEIPVKVVEDRTKVEKNVVEIKKPEVTKSSKVGISIQAKTIEKGLTDSFGGTAEYSPITIKEQAKMASDLINTDLKKAKSVVLGQEPLPTGMRAGTILKAMEDYALEKGDAELLRDIANSPLTAETSLHAQELRLLAERNPDSAVIAIKKVADARAEAIKKRTGKTVDKAVKEEVAKIKKEVKVIDKYDWNTFISSITC